MFCLRRACLPIACPELVAGPDVARPMLVGAFPPGDPVARRDCAIHDRTCRSGRSWPMSSPTSVAETPVERSGGAGAGTQNGP